MVAGIDPRTTASLATRNVGIAGSRGGGLGGVWSSGSSKAVFGPDHDAPIIEKALRHALRLRKTVFPAIRAVGLEGGEHHDAGP